jgi:hypothetical protein
VGKVILIILASLFSTAEAAHDIWDVHEAVATGTAKASHQFDPGDDRLQLSLAYGTYDYAHAYDVALGKKVTDYMFISGNIGETDDDYAVGVSVLFYFP